MSFKAILLQERDGKVSASVEQLDEDRLPPGGVTVRVRWSTLNYKDGMILKGLGRLVRKYPHIPGVDFAGEVESSDDPAFAPGDPVILTGWRVGESQWGGYAGKARVRPEWLVKLPPGLTPKRAMAIGTAGLPPVAGPLGPGKHRAEPHPRPGPGARGARGGGRRAPAPPSGPGREARAP